MTLEERIQRLEDATRKDTEGKIIATALLNALQQGLQEACSRLGVSEEQFSQRFQALGQWHYSRLMDKATDIAPSFAAESDTRSIEQIPTDEHPPRIFSPDDL